MDEHLDHALEEEFSGHGETIRRLKLSDAHFRNLLTRNHDLWSQIQKIQNNITPAEDAVRHTLEKQRLAILDEIGQRLRQAET